MKRFLFYLALAVGICLLAWRMMAGEARLNIEQRPDETVLYITGGTSNVQYQIWTEANNRFDGTNWYYWRHAYSSTFKTNSEIRVQGTNVTYRAQRVFQIRGEVLPD